MMCSCPLWALTVQTVLQPVELPQVQFLGVVDVFVVCMSGHRRCRSCSFSTRLWKSLLWRWLASLFLPVHSRFIAYEVDAALVVDFGMCIFIDGFAGDFCISRCIPFDCRQAQVAWHHDRCGPVGQFFRCRGGQCCQESGTCGSSVSHSWC